MLICYANRNSLEAISIERESILYGNHTELFSALKFPSSNPPANHIDSWHLENSEGQSWRTSSLYTSLSLTLCKLRNICR